MMTVAIIGCGNIGTEIAGYLNKDKRYSIVALADINSKNFIRLNRILRKPLSLSTINDAIEKADLIIEAANKEVVSEILKCKKLDLEGKHLLIMSTGGLIENLYLLNKIKNCRIHIPSGAIAGLDAIRAVQGKIKFLSLTTTKPVTSFKSAPYILQHKTSLKSIESKRKIFEGNLHRAIRAFPQNINVAASLFLSSRFWRIKISIVADAKAKFNTHEIICKGSFGEIRAVTKNLPSKNPKTSYLAILSAIAVVKSMAENISIGN